MNWANENRDHLIGLLWALRRAELLVGSFQSRRNVEGIAIGRVVKEAGRHRKRLLHGRRYV
jgi:hypothetical protein